MGRTKMAKIYISGKIDGVEDYKERFLDAEKFLLSDFTEWKDGIAQIVNPATKGIQLQAMYMTRHKRLPTYEEYLADDIKELANGCTAIFMLDNWKDSKGAKIELDLAKKLGLKVYYENKVKEKLKAEKEKNPSENKNEIDELEEIPI